MTKKLPVESFVDNYALNFKFCRRLILTYPAYRLFFTAAEDEQA